jgi:hypothetical protein
VTNLSASLDKKGIKKHGSPEEAQKCYGSYLVNVVGCTKLSSREFKHPDGPIEVLTKAARFGARLRSGKHGETGQGKSRGMPSKVHGGVIIAG